MEAGVAVTVPGEEVVRRRVELLEGFYLAAADHRVVRRAARAGLVAHVAHEKILRVRVKI